MKRLAIAALLLLSGCQEHRGPPMDMDSMWERSDIVLVCQNGTVITHDPASGRYIVRTTGWTGSRGLLAPGIKPKEACE